MESPEITPDRIPRLVQAAVGERYQILRFVGQGGMAWVCEAEDPARGATVAVKVLKPGLRENVAHARILKEIRIGRAIAHPSVMPVLDCSTSGDQPWLTMPLASDGPLRRQLKRATDGMELGAAFVVIRSLVAAVAAIHEKAFIHRDLTPENILHAKGQYWVTDLGIACEVDIGSTDQTLTPVGVGLGRYEYISPEQLRAERVDVRSDLYSVGIIAYEVLTGMRPLDAKTYSAWLAAKEQGAVVPVTKRRPSVPASLASLVDQCLRPQAADRPQSAKHLLRQLDDILNHSLLGAARSLTQVNRSEPWLDRAMRHFGWTRA